MNCCGIYCTISLFNNSLRIFAWIYVVSISFYCCFCLFCWSRVCVSFFRFIFYRVIFSCCSFFAVSIFRFICFSWFAVGFISLGIFSFVCCSSFIVCFLRWFFYCWSFTSVWRLTSTW